METEPLERLDRIDEHASGETPEDVAILYSWANLQGAKYRDFSANRREYRAQMRHRAAEQLRMMELRAQSEAEAAAAQAEADAAAAHAEADAATVKLAASRSLNSIAPEEILKEKEVEELRRSSLREAAQQARRAAAERLEAARRAEAAALADSIAKREEREIAEAQASALRQAAQYHESEMRSRQMHAQHPDFEDQVPGRISDPYSPQILAEGEYYDGPGTPTSELEPNRFRVQREYIERSTGTELPQFKMPPLFNENRLDEKQPDEDWLPPPPLPSRVGAGSNEDARRVAAEAVPGREGRSPSLPVAPWPVPAERAAEPIAWQQPAQFSDRGATSGEFYRASRAPVQGAAGDGVRELPRPPRAEVVSRIARDIEDSSRKPVYDGSLLEEARAEEKREALRPRAPRFMVNPEPEQEWGEREEQKERPQPYFAPPASPSSPRPSGSWLREISARNPDSERRSDPVAPIDRRSEAPLQASVRPPAGPAYAGSERGGETVQPDRMPSGFRPPWLSVAQSPQLPTGLPRATHATNEAEDHPAPRWLYPSQTVASAEAAIAPQVKQRIQPTNHEPEPTSSLPGSPEQVGSRWFALKGVFARTEASPRGDRPVPSEKRVTPTIAVYSLAGGVGKTSLVATLGRALSSLGERVLLADTTSHGLLPFYFGASGLVPGVVRTFTPPTGSPDAPIHLVSLDLQRHGVETPGQADPFESLMASSEEVNRVLLDLNGGGWPVERLARLKPTILVPVTADMNSIVSLQAVEKKFAAMHGANGTPLRPVYLLNQFDASLPLHLDLREILRQQLGDRLLPFVIHRSAGISEALAEGMTIVDYDPDSTATQDFMGLANWVRSTEAPAATGLRGLRWSER